MGLSGRLCGCWVRVDRRSATVARCGRPSTHSNETFCVRVSQWPTTYGAAMAGVGRRPAMATKRAIVGRELRRLLMGEQVCLPWEIGRRLAPGGQVAPVHGRIERAQTDLPAIGTPTDSQHPLVSQRLLCAMRGMRSAVCSHPPLRRRRNVPQFVLRLARTSGVRRVDKVTPTDRRPLLASAVRRGVVAMSSGVRSEITAKKCTECRFTRSPSVCGVGVGGRHRGGRAVRLASRRCSHRARQAPLTNPSSRRNIHHLQRVATRSSTGYL